MSSLQPYTPNPDPDAMAKVQHIWDWYFAVAEARGLPDLVDYRMMRDLKLIDARPEGRSVWSLTIPRYLCNLNCMPTVLRNGRQRLSSADWTHSVVTWRRSGGAA